MMKKKKKKNDDDEEEEHGETNNNNSRNVLGKIPHTTYTKLQRCSRTNKKNLHSNKKKRKELGKRCKYTPRATLPPDRMYVTCIARYEVYITDRVRKKCL